MKTNKEIVVEELKKQFGNLLGNYTGWDFIATTLLSKLQTLDREKVMEIILKTSAIEELELKDGSKIAYRVIGQAGFKSMIDQIYLLIPEGIVIAEGLFSLSEYRELIINNKLMSLFALFNKLVGKRGKLVFMEERGK